MQFSISDMEYVWNKSFAGHQSTAEHGSWPGSGSLRLYGEYKISLGITMRNLDIKLERDKDKPNHIGTSQLCNTQ